jgi:hypothetical protein
MHIWIIKEKWKKKIKKNKQYLDNICVSIQQRKWLKIMHSCPPHQNYGTNTSNFLFMPYSMEDGNWREFLV